MSLPLSPPTFERSNRYHDGGWYFQDSWKVAHTITLNLGLRWDYYGVQHNVNPSLDSNFYPSNTPNIPLGIADGQVLTTPQSPIGELWSPQPPQLRSTSRRCMGRFRRRQDGGARRLRHRL